MKIKLGKIRIMAGCVLLAVLVSFGACKQKVQNKTNIKIANNLEAGSQVRFLGHWLEEGKREKLVRDFVRQYGFKNQDVEISFKFPEDIYFNRTQSNSNEAFIANAITNPNVEWDIIRLNDQYEQVVRETNDTLWAEKYLVDFSQIPEFVRNTRPELLTDEMKRRWGGIIPGPYLEGQYWSLWSNAEVAKKVGIEIKQIGMTADDFASYIKAVDTYNKNNPDDYIVPVHEASDWRTTWMLAYHMFKTELNDEELLHTIGVNERKTAAWAKTLKYFEELSHYNMLSPECQKITWAESRFDLPNGKCLFYSNGSWMYNIWEEENSELTMNCFPNEYPVVNPATEYPSGYLITWGVLKNSPNKEAAIDFLLAMNTPDVAEMWVQYTKCPTGIKGNLTDVSFGTDQFEKFSNYLQTNYGAKVYKVDEGADTRKVFDIPINVTYYKEVMLGQMTADEAMVKIMEDIENQSLE